VTAPTPADLLRRAEEREEASWRQGSLFTDRVGRQWMEYHRGHPEVFRRLVEVARRYKALGIRRGMGFFFEILRHEHLMSDGDHCDAQGFALNNSYRSRYARAIEGACDDLRGYFRKRALRAPAE